MIRTKQWAKATQAFALTLALLGLLATTEAPPSDPQAILATVIARNEALQTYQGRVHVNVKMTSFPFLREHLAGAVYYKRPGNYEVVFDRVPGYAKGFSKLFGGDVADPTDWNQRFVVSYEGESEFRGHMDATLRLVQRNRGRIDHETVLVDPHVGTIEQIRYDYYDGGSITMTQTFANIAGYAMLASQDAEVAIPHVHAVAHSDYSDYRTNVAIDDAVFTKGTNR